MASAWKPVIAILLLCIAALPMTISAEQSGSIQASENTVALLPAAPEAGGSVTIYLTLSNSGTYATDVEYAFYRDGIGQNKLIESSTIDIDTGESEEVSAVWEGLTEGDHEVHITFEHPRNSGNEVDFYVEFTVTGLPNLKVTETQLSPSSGIFAGDTVQISSLVRKDRPVLASGQERSTQTGHGGPSRSLSSNRCAFHDKQTYRARSIADGSLR